MLIIKNLHAGVDGKEILKGIDLEIKAGEVHAIMGPNGAGKSTLSSVISGNENFEVTEGDILLNGESLLEDAPEERAHKGIFMSFQYPVEIPGISVTNFIKTAINESRKAQGLPDMPAAELLKKIREKAALLEINPDFLSRSLNQGFSGGEKKKAEILQLLMLSPKLAILDETDSGLDVDAVRTVSAGIKEYQKKKDGALLIITHSTRILESLKVDYTHIMVDGKIIKTGDASLVDDINENGFEKYIQESK